ncbi:MAG: hypothetical protein L6R41_000835 [Letrouitia leprolyta]|nr:MAG: hypothetical protein L6R41_000835 [Letrouitia leprolyta]
MADAPPPPAAAISAAFPAPPPFYKSFTSANLAHLSSLQQSSPSLTIDDLPPELENLLPPPPPPPNTHYRTFGEIHQSPAPPIKELPPKEPPNPHRLLQTTRQLLLTFLSLTNALVEDPDSWAPKWDEMRALFSEAHAIVNEYRPHQARETLIHMMEEQVERCKLETKACEEACERVREVLEQVEKGEGLLQPGTGTTEVDGQSKSRKEKDLKARTENRIWEVIEQEVGSFD